MSVRVNLLPEATKASDRAAQQRSFVALGVVLVLAGLGGVYWWALSQERAAEDDLVAAQEVSAELRAEQAELVAFADLADRRDQADETLIAALTHEVSVAAILQDLAAVTPGDAQVETLTVQLTPPAEDVLVPVVGQFNIGGRTLTSHAPGVERVLLALDKIVTFDDVYLNSSSLDDPESSVAAFSVDGQIGPTARTDRYSAGLPEEMR